MGAIIGPGVRIGAEAFVGAGSLVLDSVHAGDVVYGSPARVMGRRSDLECKTGLFDGKPYDALIGGQ
jgi:acetyltransferase-like isoleucine patch superfamily enzyme